MEVKMIVGNVGPINSKSNNQDEQLEGKQERSHLVDAHQYMAHYPCTPKKEVQGFPEVSPQLEVDEQDEQFERDLYDAIFNVFNSYSIPLSSENLILDSKDEVYGNIFEIIFDLEKNKVSLNGMPYYEDTYTVEILPSL
jgi:hypothetical protein